MLAYSEKFYKRYAGRYAEVSHQLPQSIYIESSRPKLTGDLDRIEHLKTLVPGKHGLDAGCGAGARDVYSLWLDGYSLNYNKKKVKMVRMCVIDQNSMGKSAGGNKKCLL